MIYIIKTAIFALFTTLVLAVYFLTVMLSVSTIAKAKGNGIYGAYWIVIGLGIFLTTGLELQIGYTVIRNLW